MKQPKYKIGQKVFKIDYHRQTPESLIIKGIELNTEGDKKFFKYYGEENEKYDEQELFESFDEIKQYFVAEAQESFEERINKIKRWKEKEV